MVAGSLAVFVVVYQWLGVQPFVTAQFERNLALAGTQVHERLSAFFDHVALDLEDAKSRGVSGRFSLEDPAALNAWFFPYLSHARAVSSVLFADEQGKEVLLLQLSDGNWMNRLSDPVRNPGRIRVIRRRHDGEVISDRQEASDYDSRIRPWFQGAMALSSDSLLNWTKPYTLFTTREPGFTVSTRWTGVDGKRYILAFDVLLRDLSAAVRKLQVSRSGFAALITDDGRVLAPPRYGILDDEDVAMALMKPVAEIEAAPLQAAFASWKHQGSPSNAVLSVAVGGRSWFARIERYVLGPRSLSIVTMAPASDFVLSQRPLFTGLAGAGFLVLLLGMWVASRLARRVGEPLEALIEDSERIGRLDFSGRPQVDKRWREIAQLAQAQRKMSRLLQSATERLEHSNEELESRVAARTKQLQEANAELASFSYAVSHDLRSPLRSINGFCSLLESDHAELLDDDARGLLLRVREASSRMGELIDGLLAVARLSTHSPKWESVDLSALARQVVTELRRSNPEREVDCSIAAGCHARGDVALLRSVLQNLIGNAWKYTANTLEARVSFDCIERDGETVFRVRDNGAGFDMVGVDKLFKPFQRLHRPDEYPGTGIGLATVQRIVKMHGGRIWAESKLHEGATFYFTLSAPL